MGDIIIISIFNIKTLALILYSTYIHVCYKVSIFWYNMVF